MSPELRDAEVLPFRTVPSLIPAVASITPAPISESLIGDTGAVIPALRDAEVLPFSRRRTPQRWQPSLPAVA